jgi:hypothetical protein
LAIFAAIRRVSSRVRSFAADGGKSLFGVSVQTERHEDEQRKTPQVWRRLNSSGSLAMFAAIRRASSFVSSFAANR